MDERPDRSGWKAVLVLIGIAFVVWLFVDNPAAVGRAGTEWVRK
jgi:hypothetical protein